MFRYFSILIVLTHFQIFAQLTFNCDKIKPIVEDTNYQHNKWGISDYDLRFDFAAFTCSFDSEDDDNGDGISDIWGIPEWVAYEVKKDARKEKKKHKRPSWMTDDSLHALKIAPSDASYHVSGVNDMREVKTSYRYVRGHMCPKSVAERISAEAGYNTHVMINAVPQLQWQNNGIWKRLEEKTEDWADKHGRVWVICGPVFFNKTPAVWLGQDDEVKAAVPDALFKIVIREQGKKIYTLSFIIPNVLPKEEDDFMAFLTPLDRIEKLTGLDFLTELKESDQKEIESMYKNLPKKEKEILLKGWDGKD